MFPTFALSLALSVYMSFHPANAQIVDFKAPAVVEQDVFVIGNSLGGLYTATRLRQQGKRVSLWTTMSDNLESTKFPSYRDEDTGLTIEVGPYQDTESSYGFVDNSFTRSLFNYIGVETTKVNRTERQKAATESIKNFWKQDKLYDSKLFDQFEELGGVGAAEFYDFSKNLRLKASDYFERQSYSPSEKLSISQYKWLYDNYLDQGIPLTEEVKTVLYEPTGNHISSSLLLSKFLFGRPCEGLGDIMDQPLFLVLEHCLNYAQQTLIAESESDDRSRPRKPISRNYAQYTLSLLNNTQGMYEKLHEKLSSHKAIKLLPDSGVRLSRDGAEIKTWESTGGKNVQPTTFRARHVVIAEEPTQHVLKLFKSENDKALDRNLQVFKTLRGTWLFSSLIEDNFLSPVTSYFNRPINSSRFDMPSGLGVNEIRKAEIKNMRVAHYTGTYPIDETIGRDRGKQNDTKRRKEGANSIIRTFFGVMGLVDRSITRQEGVHDFEVNHGHTAALRAPYMLSFSPEDAQRGAYEDIQRLQGQHGLWWASPLFNSHNVGRQWHWIERNIIPKLLREDEK